MFVWCEWWWTGGPCGQCVILSALGILGASIIAGIEEGAECLERRHPSIQHSLTGKFDTQPGCFFLCGRSFLRTLKEHVLICVLYLSFAGLRVTLFFSLCIALSN